MAKNRFFGQKFGTLNIALKWSKHANSCFLGKFRPICAILEKITKIKLRIRSLILIKNKKKKSSCLPNIQAPSFFLKNYYKRPNLLEKIAKIRRRNYFILSYKLEKIGYKSFKSLKKDKLSVPQWWIYYDSTKNLNKYLRTQGIGSCCWPGE